MKITLKANLWEHKADKDGLCPVAISIRGGGKETYYNTGIKVHPDFWNGKELLKGAENYDIKNNKLSNLIKNTEREILNKELQGERVDLDYVKKLLRPDSVKDNDFYSFAIDIIATKNPTTKRRYTIEIDKLKLYAPALSFGDITAKWLTGYHKHLLVKNHHNTAINAFKVIRHVFNEAKEAGLTSLYPFENWKYPQYKAPKRVYLTLDECEKLFKLLERKDVSKDMKLVTAFFLLECFSGIRVSDWGKFSVEKVVRNNDMIFTTTKTNTDVRLPLDLMPSLSRIMDYINTNNLQYTQDGYFANSKLNDIAPLAEIDKELTTHIARHTFATQCLSIGMDKEAIGLAMGITTKQVDTYAKVVPDKIRNTLQRIGGGV